MESRQMKQPRLGLDVGLFAHAQKQSLLRGVHIGNELCWFGIGVVEKAFTQFGERVVASLFTRKRLVNKLLLGEFVSQSPRNLLSRGSVVTMHLTQAEPDSLRGNNSTPVVQHIQNVPVSLRHPRDRWRH